MLFNLDVQNSTNESSKILKSNAITHFELQLSRKGTFKVYSTNSACLQQNPNLSKYSFISTSNNPSLSSNQILGYSNGLIHRLTGLLQGTLPCLYFHITYLVLGLYSFSSPSSSLYPLFAYISSCTFLIILPFPQLINIIHLPSPSNLSFCALSNQIPFSMLGCTLLNKLAQLPAVGVQKLPGSFWCYSNLSPKVIQPIFDAQSLQDAQQLSQFFFLQWGNNSEDPNAMIHFKTLQRLKRNFTWKTEIIEEKLPMIGENNVDTGEIIKQTGSIIHFKGGATFLNAFLCVSFRLEGNNPIQCCILSCYHLDIIVCKVLLHCSEPLPRRFLCESSKKKGRPPNHSFWNVVCLPDLLQLKKLENKNLVDCIRILFPESVTDRHFLLPRYLKQAFSYLKHFQFSGLKKSLNGWSLRACYNRHGFPWPLSLQPNMSAYWCLIGLKQVLPLIATSRLATRGGLEHASWAAGRSKPGAATGSFARSEDTSSRLAFVEPVCSRGRLHKNKPPWIPLPNEPGWDPPGLLFVEPMRTQRGLCYELCGNTIGVPSVTTTSNRLHENEASVNPA
ncbi:hypothetical protein VP01_1518g1 [Puccinia sorghi]|uniref:Uncharacterized protein n=1 Tax=Puccinia sorghi TaxID=27349 RepID=A0A0L6VIV3_9BASI|nr:hypothetical protein VP01_1518g1 [Puccinia sorghi]